MQSKSWSKWWGLNYGLGWGQHVGKTDLHIFHKGTLTAQRYVDEVLDVYVRLYAVSMNDNARPHRVRVTNILKMKRLSGWTRLRGIDWTCLGYASESDLARPVNLTTTQELRKALLEEWVRIPQDAKRGLISSMRRRCQAVINANGHNISILTTSLHFSFTLKFIPLLTSMRKNLKASFIQITPLSRFSD
jgi:hypothetical protein